MASSDFKKLMELLFESKYKIVNYTAGYSKEKGESGKVTLKKDSDEITLESRKEDFCLYLFQLKKTIDKEGNFQLSRVKKGAKYYDNIDLLVDQDGKKKKDAFEKILKGEFSFGYDIESLFEKFISNNYGKKDEDIRKLLTDYFEIFAGLTLFAKKYVDLRDDVAKKNSTFRIYERQIEKILGDYFFPQENKLRAYIRFKKHKNYSFEKLAIQSLGEVKYIDDQFRMLSERGTVPGEFGIKQLLDVYRRYCELCFEFVNFIRIAIQSKQGDENPKEYWGYVENVNYIKKDKRYRKVVDCINPFIRHSESHINTRIVKEKGLVVITERARGKEERSEEISFQEIIKITKNIQPLMKAYLFAFAISEYTFKIVTVMSSEYRFKLLELYDS